MIFRCIIVLDFLIRGPLCFESGFYWAGDVKGFFLEAAYLFFRPLKQMKQRVSKSEKNGFRNREIIVRLGH